MTIHEHRASSGGSSLGYSREAPLRCVPLSYQSPHFRDQLWGHPLSIHPCLEVEILFIASGSLFFFFNCLLVVLKIARETCSSPESLFTGAGLALP